MQAVLTYEFVEDAIENYYKVKGINVNQTPKPDVTEIIIPSIYNGPQGTYIVKTIANSAFYNCVNLTNITFSVTLTDIGNNVFWGCNSLETIIIPNNVINIGDYAFRDCSNLSNIIFEENSQLASIGLYIFLNCTSLTSIEIPSNVTRVGSYAFSGCTNLINITLPGSITNIGNSIFEDCVYLTNIYYNGTINDWYKISFSSSSSNPMYYGKNLYLKDNEDNYYNVTALTEINIPSDITEIKKYTFYGFNNVKKVILPSIVISIGASAFEECYRLVEIYNLSNINITKGSSANGYVGCYAKIIHTSLDEPSNLVTSNGVVYYVNGTTKSAISLADINATSVIIDSNCTDVNQYAFYKSINLIKVTFKSNSQLVTIGKYAFSYSNYLTEIIFEENNPLTRIDQCAFYYCINLKDIEIPNTVTWIDSYAFGFCNSLTNIILPNSLTYINLIFYKCSNLSYILFNGQQDEWLSISGHREAQIGNTSSLYFYSYNKPSDIENNYWHYDKGKKAIWESMLIPKARIVPDNEIRDGYKIMITPIKINTTYTIYIDSNLPVCIGSAYYDGVNILNDHYTANSKDYEVYDYIYKDYSSFTQPFIYHVSEDETTVDEESTSNSTIMQNQLVMFIQLPEKSTSTVVVLEGDYTNNKLINYSIYEDNKLIKQVENGIKEKYYGESFDKLPSDVKEKYFENISSLLQVINGKNYAFSDRLIEYLTLNVITDKDEIYKNINRIQQYISSENIKKLNMQPFGDPYIDGVWNDNMRYYIYNLATQNKKDPITIDVNGFVDKDTENLILIGKEDIKNKSISMR